MEKLLQTIDLSTFGKFGEVYGEIGLAALCVAPQTQCVAPFYRRLLEAFPVSKLGTWYLVGNIFESNFQPNWNFSIWNSFSLLKIKSPKTDQNEQNEATSRKSVVAVNVWRSSSTPNWAHDSSLEIYLCLVIIWLIKKVIWPNMLGENLIFPRSLQRCIQFSWGNGIFDISLKPWYLCKQWKRCFLFGMFWTKTSLIFPKFIGYCSKTSFEWNLSRCVEQWICWNEAKWRG